MVLGTRVTQLLTRLGFQDNPFALRESDREDRQRLDDYFFHHPLFPDVLGSQDHLESVIVMAQRGGGKTTFRQAIEAYCRAQRKPVENVLDVTYIDFSRQIGMARRQGIPIDINSHVDEILRRATTRLLEVVNEESFARFDSLPPGELATLKAFVATYTPLLDSGDYGHSINLLIKRIALDNGIELGVEIGNLLDGEGPAHISKLPEGLQPVCEFLLKLQAQPARILDTYSYWQLIRDFLDVILAVNFTAMYVLVDRLDETSLLPTPEDVVNFIKPLLTDVKLLDEANLAFKIFLPQHLDTYLASRIDFRSKRISVRHLAWTEDDLLDLLARRLSSFNTSGTKSMQIFCEPNLASQTIRVSTAHPRARKVDVELVRASNNLPRDLILRCRTLFEIYEARDGTDLFTEDDLDKAVSLYLGNDEPSVQAGQGFTGPSKIPVDVLSTRTTDDTIPSVGIYIDQNSNVWRDGKPLKSSLSETEYRLLHYLFKRPNQVLHRKDILNAIWGPDQDVATLNTTLKRLREAVEYTPNKPRFLLTLHGRGIQLVNGLQTDEADPGTEPTPSLE